MLSLQAHKALLATQSDYFRVMFTADMRERDQDKIHMKGLTAAGFGHVLRFMYYGSLELSMPTVQEILQVAQHTCTRTDDNDDLYVQLSINPFDISLINPSIISSPICIRKSCWKQNVNFCFRLGSPWAPFLWCIYLWFFYFMDNIMLRGSSHTTSLSDEKHTHTCLSAHILLRFGVHFLHPSCFLPRRPCTCS